MIFTDEAQLNEPVANELARNPVETYFDPHEQNPSLLAKDQVDRLVSKDGSIFVEADKRIRKESGEFHKKYEESVGG